MHYIPDNVSAYHTVSESAFTQHYYACRVSFVVKRSGDVYLCVCSKLEYMESHAYGASRTKLYITQEYVICCDCLLYRVMSIYEWRYIVFEKGRRNHSFLWEKEGGGHANLTLLIKQITSKHPVTSFALTFVTCCARGHPSKGWSRSPWLKGNVNSKI